MIYTIASSDLGKSITFHATPRTDALVTDPAIGTEVASTAQLVAASGTLVSVSITGTVEGGVPQVGTLLTAVPTCVGSCGESLSYKWQLATAVGGSEFADISDATSNTYTPLASQQRRAIRVVVE
ncbi:hypothetical protein D3C84_1069720 [compost metagenome]